MKLALGLMKLGLFLGMALSLLSASAQTVAQPAVSASDNRIRTQLSSRNAVVLSSELAAKIADLPLRDGEAFKRGDTLVAFDCSLYDAQLKKAQAVAESAKQSVLVNKRMAELNSIGALEMQLSINKAKESEADVNYMLASVRKCVISAPYNGRIAKRLVANYQYVNMGTPLLDIVDSNSLELQMIVPSRWLAWLKPGANFSVAIEELGKNYSAKVTQMGARIDAVSQTVTITGKIETAAPELLAGMSGWASFPQP
jgi:membrane fusion protein, multidrug efflux system